MFSIIRDETRDPDRGQFYIQLTDGIHIGPDVPPRELWHRLGYWCDKGHLQTIQRNLDQEIGPDPSGATGKEIERLRAENATLQRRLEKVGLLANSDTYILFEKAIAELQRLKDGVHYEFLKVNPF